MVSIEPLLCVRHCSKYFILNPHSSGVAAIISDVSDEEIYTEITDLPVPYEVAKLGPRYFSSDATHRTS